MAWLEQLDRRAARWPPAGWLAYMCIRWTLLALGAFLWVMLWYERSPLLGLVQGVIVAVLLWRELLPALRD